MIRRGMLPAVLVLAVGLSAGVAGAGDLVKSPRPKARPLPAQAALPEAAAPAPLPEAVAPAPAALPPKPAKPARDPHKGPVTSMPLPRFVTLKTNEGNARRGPGLSHRIDWVFTRAGMPLRLTAEFENWRRVEDADGLGGWVHYSLLSGVRSVLVAQDMAEFHGRPDARSEVAFQAELGVIGRLLECGPQWCRVSVAGEKGWVQRGALWGVEPGEIIE